MFKWYPTFHTSIAQSLHYTYQTILPYLSKFGQLLDKKIGTFGFPCSALSTDDKALRNQENMSPFFNISKY